MGLFNRIKASFRALFPRRYAWPGLDISLPGGQHLHLVGSIHMGTRDMSPPPARLLKKIRQADALIVEADISGSETPFSNLPSCPPLAERLSAPQLAELKERAGEMGLSIALFDTQPLWQVAMVLQATQAQKLGLRADYGIDYQLLMAARESNIRVMELEGADSQIALLRDLPDGGLALLEDTVPDTVKAHYDGMATHASDCIGCGSCEKRCPFHVPIIKNMAEAAEIFQ